MARKGFLSSIIFVVMAAVLTGCGTVPVAYDLDQGQANQIVSVLNSNGISAKAERQIGGRGGFTVQVRSSGYARAVDIMTKKGLPSRVQESFADLIAPKGFIPDSREMEALRLDHALSIQLQELLTSLPQVDAANVVVRRHFMQPKGETGVSVTISYKGESSPDGQVIRDLVSQVVPGIEIDRVSLSQFRADAESAQVGEEGVFNKDGELVRTPLTNLVFGWRVSEEDYRGIVLFMVGFSLILCLMGVLAGYWYGYVKQQSRKLFDAELPGHGSTALRLGSGPASQLPEVD